MRVLLRILIGLGVIVALVIAVTVVRLVIGDGPPTCTVRFQSSEYGKAALLGARMDQLGYATELDGKRGKGGGPSVLTVDDDDLFLYGDASDLRGKLNAEVIGVGGGGVVEGCKDGSLGD